MILNMLYMFLHPMSSFHRYGYRQLLEGNCADIIQPDITWMGGITEVRGFEILNVMRVI